MRTKKEKENRLAFFRYDWHCPDCGHIIYDNGYFAFCRICKTRFDRLTQKPVVEVFHDS